MCRGLAWRLYTPTSLRTGLTLVYSIHKILLSMPLYPILQFTAHRALPDVEAMEELFTSTDLADLLSTLPVRSPSQQLRLRRTQKEQRSRMTSLLYAQGKCITAAQAKRLDELRLSYTTLCEIGASIATDEGFQKVLFNREYGASR